jgi:hypothetical protein
MPNKGSRIMRNNKQRGVRVRRKNFPLVPSPQSLAYKGPIPQNASEDGIVAVLRDTVAFNTGAGTSFVSYLDNNPSSSDNWSEYSTSWSEYRVLGIRFTYSPTYVVNVAAVQTAPFVTSVLHMKSTPAIASYPQALSYGDSRLGHITKPFNREWRMIGAEEGAWIDTGAPAGTTFVFTAYAETLTTALLYGTMLRTWLIQFRNPRK